LDEVSRRSVQVFRALFLAAMDNEKRFTRSLESFVSVPHTMMVEFDASLRGGGVLWFAVDEALEERFLGSSAFDFSELNFSSGSEFQNSAEFLAAVLGLIGVLALCQPPYAVKFRGDSRAALSWLQSGRIKSNRSSLAAFLFISLCLQFNVQVSEGEFIPGVSNGSADGLSRGMTVQQVMAKDPRITSVATLTIPVKKIFDLCYPKEPVTTDAQFIQFWKLLKPTVVDTVTCSVQSSFPSLTVLTRRAV
jgi:hypothetical protein